MKYLFHTTVILYEQVINYKVYLNTNGSHYAKSDNPDVDNFLLKKVRGSWETSLARNKEAATQIGSVIEAKHLV